MADNLTDAVNRLKREINFAVNYDDVMRLEKALDDVLELLDEEFGTDFVEVWDVENGS